MKYQNNPLNIRYREANHWLGQLSPKKGFCEFRSLYYGLRAAAIIISRYRAHGVKTIGSIIRRWAPPSDNNPTDNCIKFVLLKMNQLREEECLPFPYASDEVFTEDSEITSGHELEWFLRSMALFESQTMIYADESCWPSLYLNVFDKIFGNENNN